MVSAFYGGSFDPPHCGHLAVARGALASGRCDLVRFVVGAQPPHKQGLTGASFAHRAEMCRLLISGESGMEVSEIEKNFNGAVSYTVEALKLYREYYGETPVLLIGADSLLSLHTWKSAAELATDYQILTYPRKGFEVSLSALREYWDDTVAAKLFDGVLPGEFFEISSNKIRKSMAKNSLTGNISNNNESPAVREYISRHRLYQEK